MKVDHLTFLGTSYLRDSLIINLHTLTLLRNFQISQYGVRTLKFPRSQFDVKITTSEQGAVFDIMKVGMPAFMNICCFEPYHREDMLELVQAMADQLPYRGTPIKTPRTEQFLYTVPIFPHILSLDEIRTAGEIEFYIYYSLFLGRKK